MAGYDNYGVVQVKIRKAWHNCQDENGTTAIIGWNGKSDDHIPHFLREYIRFRTDKEWGEDYREKRAKKEASDEG